MSTDIERADNTPQKLPVTHRKLSRRDFTLGALATLGVTAATLKELTSPKHTEAQQRTLSEIVPSISRIIEDREAAQKRNIPVDKCSPWVEQGKIISLWELSSSARGNASVETWILHRALQDNSGMLSELRPLCSLPIIAGDFILLGPRTAILSGIDKTAAIAYVNPNDDNFYKLNIESTPKGAKSISSSFNKLVKFDGRYLFATLSGAVKTTPRLWVIKTNIDSEGKINPVLKATPLTINFDSIWVSEIINPNNPDIATVYSIHEDLLSDDRSKDGLYVRKINSATGELLPGSERQLDNRFSRSQELVDSYVDSSNQETILSVQTNAYQLINPNNPNLTVEIYAGNLFPQFAIDTNITFAQFTQNKDIILTGRFRDKTDGQTKMFVARVLKDQNPNTDPQTLQLIYREPTALIVNPRRNLELTTVGGQDLAFIPTGYGTMVTLLENQANATGFANKELSIQAPKPNYAYSLPLTERH